MDTDQNTNTKNTPSLDITPPVKGTLRTLQTDLDSGLSAQDRLQQTGNFLDARPNIDLVQDTNNIAVPSSEVDTKPGLSGFTTSHNLSDESGSIWGSDSGSTVNAQVSWDTQSSNDIESQEKNSDSLGEGNSLKGFDIDVEQDRVQDEIPVSNSETAISSQNVDTASSLSPLGQPSGFQFGLTEDELKQPPKKTFPIRLVVLVSFLILAIGGGITFYVSQIQSPDISTDISNAGTNNQVPNVKDQYFVNAGQVTLDIKDGDILRSKINEALADKTESLIALSINKSGSTMAFSDFASQMNLTIPDNIIDQVSDYTVYGYNQTGIYKIAMLVVLEEGQDSQGLVSQWSARIPRDMSGFSLSSASRAVTVPTINTTTLISGNEVAFANYYYNYTASTTESIDIATRENIILFGSSQETMRYLINQYQAVDN